MAIQATINSPDLNAQIEILKHFPQITAKHYVPALKTSVAAIAAVVRPLIPRRTGRSAQTFGTKVSGRSIQNLAGRVGWFDKDDPWQINIVEYGAKRHFIAPKSSNRTRGRRLAAYQAMDSAKELGINFLAWPVFIQGVGWRRMDIHPGFAARGFLAAGYAATKPIVEREMGAAGEKVVNELASIKSFGIGGD